MQELVFEEARTVSWREVPDARIGSGRGALVRPLVVSTCDMDAIALSGVIRFRSGTPLGHECVAEVVAVGVDVETVVPGDVVVVPWQISCGTCARCVRGHLTYCTEVPAGSCYGWGPHVDRWRGFMADLVEVPFADHMLVPVPAGLHHTHACGLSDNLVDAWRAVVPPLQETGGGRVLVVGGPMGDGGSIGLYSVAFALDAGADEVVFASQDTDARRMATSLGATPLAAQDGYPDAGLFDVMADTSGLADGLRYALRSGGPHSICTCTAGAVHRGAPPEIPMYEMYMNTVQLRTGWVPTRALLDQPLARMVAGAFDPTDIAITATFDQAVDAFARPFKKLVLTR